MRIQEHISLKELTTMKIGGTARYFTVVTTTGELREAMRFSQEKRVPVVIFGGGSNILIGSGKIDALVMKIEIKGIAWESDSPLQKGVPSSETGRDLNPPSRRLDHPPFKKEESDSVLVIVGAGESWDGLVSQAVERGLWGLENLSGIPGTVGAAPVQNIGAYGAEVKDIIRWVEVFDTKTEKLRKLTNAECGFGYRDSFFKSKEGKQLIIIRVAFRLKKDGVPNLAYKDLKERFKIQDSRFKKEEPTLAKIRKAVLEIRSKKFPDLKEFGTAGSFFKNPIIPEAQFAELKKKFPDLPGFPLPSTVYRLPSVKIPLAWILDNICGLKGFEKGNVKLFEKQPIVLVQNGSASAEEIESFAKEIISQVKMKTGIEVEWEVQRMV